MTEIGDVFDGLRYRSPERELSYQKRGIVDVFVVLQHYSSKTEFLNKAKEMHDMFESDFLFA